MKQDLSILSITKRYQVSDNLRGFFQLFLTLGILIGFYCLGISALPHSICIAILCSILASAFLLRIFIIQHDCSHRSLVKSRSMNDFVGGVLSVFTMTPFYCWRRFHSQHHAYSGNLDKRGFGDINTLTVREFLALTWLKKSIYIVYRNPIVLFLFGPIIIFIIRQRFTYYIPKNWKKERKSVHLTNVAILILFYLMFHISVLRTFIPFYLLTNVLAGSCGIWLFYVQHQFEDTYWQNKEEWSYVDAALEGATFYDLPKALHWISGYIGFHHIHHLNPNIPNYQLKKCFLLNPELQQFKRINLIESLSCIKFKLWDEDLRQMVGFRQVRNIK